MDKAIMVDLDGTLADCVHRRHYMENGKRDWAGFYGEMGKDPLNEWCKTLILACRAQGFKILLVSGRPSNYMHETIFWLDKFDVPYDDLFMRIAGDHRDDSITKKELYEQHIKGVYDVLFVVDDRRRVVDMWRAEGLTCLQCAEGNF